MRRTSSRPANQRAVYTRATQSIKLNSPDGWMDTNGPVWWYGSDQMSGWLSPLADTPAGMSAVTRATSLIVNRIASSRWEVNGEQPRWLRDPTLTRSDAGYPMQVLPAALRVPRSVFWGQWIRSALLWGMGWFMAVPDLTGAPTPGSMLLLHPSTVTPDPSDPGLRRIGIDTNSVTTSREGIIDGGPFKLYELRCPVTPLDPRTGWTPGVLTYHAHELGLVGDIHTYATQTFAGAGIPSGYLKVETPGLLNQDMADKLKAQWMAAHGAGSRSVAVLNAATSYQPIAVSPVDSGLIDMKKLSLVDVANAFGVPFYMVGAPSGSPMTYSNVQMEKEALYEFTLRPWAVAIEETLSALLPGEQKLDIRAEGDGSGQSSPGIGTAGTPADLPPG